MTEHEEPLDDDVVDAAPGIGAAGYRRFYHQSPVPTLTLDLNRRKIIDCNQAALDFLEQPRERVIGKAGADFLAEPTPDEVLRVRGLRGETTRAIRNVQTGRGVRIAELNIVPSDVEGVVFVQTHDLTEMLDANVILERRTSELQTKTEQLESLAGRIAHDLRAPLATIGGFVDLLRTRPDDFPAEQRESIFERISVNVKTLATMISDMLDEAMLSDTVDPDASTSVADLFAGLRSICDVELLAVGGALHTRSDVAELPVSIASIRQTIVNLIGNSIKFRRLDHDLVVSVEIATDRDFTVISVIDNGRGLEGDPERFFDAGVRAASTSEVGGRGLGLAFSRQAIESLGGTLTAVDDGSARAGAGACFQIRLPRVATDDGDGATPGFGGTYAGGLTARQLDRILELAPTPTLLIDLAARGIVRVNAAAERALGMPASEILGRRGRDFLLDPTDGDALRSDVLLRGGGRAGTVTTLRTAKGDVLVEVALAAVPDTTLSIVQFHPAPADLDVDPPGRADDAEDLPDRPLP